MTISLLSGPCWLFDRNSWLDGLTRQPSFKAAMYNGVTPYTALKLDSAYLVMKSQLLAMTAHSSAILQHMNVQIACVCLVHVGSTSQAVYVLGSTTHIHILCIHICSIGKQQPSFVCTLRAERYSMQGGQALQQHDIQSLSAVGCCCHHHHYCHHHY